jgi:fatty acid desaturase
MSATLTAPPTKSLNDPVLKEKLQELRRTDNVTNLYYLVRTYFYLILVIGATVWFDLYRQGEGWHWAVSFPVFLVAILLVGAGQHQLSGLAHEGSHHILFRNRYFNELASDIGCLFPLFSSTHHYRLQHLAHHQFVNDPLRDPDVSQLQTSGHWLKFPISRKGFVNTLLKQLWLPNLFRFMRIRAAYNATGTDKNPYMKKGIKASKLVIRVAMLYLVTQVGLLTAFVWNDLPMLLATVPPALFIGMVAFLIAVPESLFHQSRVHSIISQRWMSVLRVSFITVVFNAVAWTQLLTGQWAALYYFLLWLVPLFTSFSFFMILRQLVQHGNGDRGWLTNTRIFFVNRLINFAVFPMGQDYHLPHHLYATVPHYRLRDLHEVLLQYPEYREQALEVHGYFLSPERPPVHPTVLDVLGPDYAAREFHGVHIDNTVLEDCEVEEKADILREGEMEAKRVAEQAGRGA